MALRISAGLVLYRIREGRLQVLLTHPGGPYFAWKDAGYWSIPKGEIDAGEEALQAAIREVREETGITIEPRATFLELGAIRQKGGKVVQAWGVEYDDDVMPPADVSTFEIEWPPGSGHMEHFPEVDRVEFFTLRDALTRIKETQAPLLERLHGLVGG